MLEIRFCISNFSGVWDSEPIIYKFQTSQTHEPPFTVSQYFWQFLNNRQIYNEPNRKISFYDYHFYEQGNVKPEDQTQYITELLQFWFYIYGFRFNCTFSQFWQTPAIELGDLPQPKGVHK